MGIHVDAEATRAVESFVASVAYVFFVIAIIGYFI